MREKIELIKELISIVEENDLAELNIDFKGMKVEIKKEVTGAAVTPVMMPPTMAPITGAPSPPPSAPTPQKKPISKGVPIKSPLSGVFYRSLKPGSPPFVNVGEVVEAGQTLCIVEAMKLMNEISAEQRGKVTEICKENAEIAHEGEVLFYLEPM